MIRSFLNISFLDRDKWFLIILVSVTLTACSTSEYVVESDYSYSGTFHKYKSFAFGTNEGFDGSEEEKELVEKYIGNVLTAWGYQVDDRRPDIYVFYSIYYDDFRYKGYHQPELQHWIYHNHPEYIEVLMENESETDSLEILNKKSSRMSMREQYESVTYDLREGTMLIALMDRKKKKTIWQGYASGILGPDQAKNQRVLRSAIIRILDEFKLLSYSS